MIDDVKDTVKILLDVFRIYSKRNIEELALSKLEPFYKIELIFYFFLH